MILNVTNQYKNGQTELSTLLIAIKLRWMGEFLFFSATDQWLKYLCARKESKYMISQGWSSFFWLSFMCIMTKSVGRLGMKMTNPEIKVAVQWDTSAQKQWNGSNYSELNDSIRSKMTAERQYHSFLQSLLLAFFYFHWILLSFCVCAYV